MIKYFSVLACAIILFPLSAGSAILGDINSDGRIDLSEAIFALRVSAGLLDPTDQGDINGDGETDLSEVIYALQVSVGLHPQAFLTVVSETGRIWMDRNLGASRVAISFDDPEAYGDLYQWGRLADGHESRGSSTTSTLSVSDVPGHGDFITHPDTPPQDWRTPQNDNLWQGATNNPCPSGFRLPTSDEFATEQALWIPNNSEGAFKSPLKMVVAGSRQFWDGLAVNGGTAGFYWSSTVSTVVPNFSDFLFFSSGSVINLQDARASGYSVRCIKE